jgi:hypothetical protein
VLRISQQNVENDLFWLRAQPAEIRRGPARAAAPAIAAAALLWGGVGAVCVLWWSISTVCRCNTSHYLVPGFLTSSSFYYLVPATFYLDTNPTSPPSPPSLSSF